MENKEQTASETATLGAGCYWCIEAMFRQVQGVKSIFSGFTSGENKAEVIQITYDPEVLSFAKILKCLFRMHDCTDPKFASGVERSIVCYHNQAQKELISDFINLMQSQLDVKIVTEIAAYPGFTPAKESEQDYYGKNQSNEHCSGYIKPKIAKFLRDLREV